jgi:rhodanese-related sulfurtransferase
MYQRLWATSAIAIVILVALLAPACQQESSPTPTTPLHTPPSQTIEDIAIGQAYALIQDNHGNPDFAIIDVRTPEEYANGYIGTAVNSDYYSATFTDELNRLDKDKTYLIYCRSGRRSASALDIMRELGFGEVYNMLGGILQWEAEGLPIVE